MAAEFGARLFSALEETVAGNSTGFGSPEWRDGPDPPDLVVPSSEGTGVAIAVTGADVDPHSPGATDRARRLAREAGTPLFATANPNDAFLFRRGDPSAPVPDLDRWHYDLRDRPVPDVAGTVLDDAAGILGTVEPGAGAGETAGYEEFLVARLRSFHASLSPLYRDLVAGECEESEGFRDRLREWARDNDVPHEGEDRGRTVRTVAERYACLLADRILFYESVRQRGDGPSLPALSGVAPGELDDHLRDCFESMAGRVGYGPVVAADGDVFEAVPDDGRTWRRLHGFAASVEREPLAGVDADVVGRVYEGLVTADERERLGQFYTSDDVARTLALWAVRSPDDRFLDPCSGSGAITVRAYDRLAELGGLSHRAVLRRITAVELDAFGHHLTALNLATRAVPGTGNDDPGEESGADSVASPADPADGFAHHADFFDLNPGSDGPTDGNSGPAGESIGRFDATAANPPYVRQERLRSDREHFREHLRRFGPDGEAPYYDGDRAIDGRSDLYCYFLTHATRFLRDGGRLAWIVPTKWLTADYGASFRRFLFDHYSVRAVVGFRERVFEDALVDTVLLMAERCDDAGERRATETNFVRVNEPLDPRELVRVVDRTHGIPRDSDLAIHGGAAHRTVAVRQSHLMDDPGTKLHHFVDAPALYAAVLEHGDTRPLGEFTTVTRGKKTGANPIFVLDGEEARTVGPEFRRPAIKSVREVGGWEYTAEDAEKWLLDLHDYAGAVRSRSGIEAGEAGDGTPPDTADRVLSSLRDDGHDGVVSYLEWASEQDARDNATLETYDPWFDMGDLDPETAPVVCPQAMDTRRFFFRTDGSVVPSNRFLLVEPDGTDPDLLLGLLNSSVSKIVVESHGRVTGGGAVNLSGSDLRSFRVVDPDCLTDEQAERVANGFARLRDGDGSGLDEIDATLVDVLDLDVTVDELQAIAENLKVVRRTKGQEVEPLVRELDELEGRIEMSFGSEDGRQGGLSEYGD